MVIVYLLRNMSNGKMYVGQTSQRFEKRWVAHLSDARRGSNLRLHRAIRKYGPNSFFCAGLFHFAGTEQADLWEKHCISVLGTQDEYIGYNMADGGQGRRGPTGWKPTPEQLLKMSLSHKGRKQSPEHRRKRGLARRGCTYSPETIRRMAEGQRRRYLRSEEHAKLGRSQRLRHARERMANAESHQVR